MNYIGSKYRLSEFIIGQIRKTAGELDGKHYAELFAGTGIIARMLKPSLGSVVVNDLEYYSYVLLKNHIANKRSFKFQERLKQLNGLNGREGFIYKNYCRGGGTDRQYFSDENGLKIDAARKRIEDWKKKGLIKNDEYYFYLASLIQSADKVANTAAVYGAYLKQVKKTAQKSMIIEPALFEKTAARVKVYQEDANKLIKKCSGDILYLDPPYNARQYGANYHMLNTIAAYKSFTPKGKTGLPDYNRSDYCSKRTVADSLEHLIAEADFEFVFLSYNNEGLLDIKEVKKIFSRFGKYRLARKKYSRFKADKTANRNHKANSTEEYLHVLVKS